MKSHRFFRHNRQGSILIYILWLTALLALFTLAMGTSVRQRLRILERLEARRILRLAAESGIARAQAVIDRPKDPEKPYDALSQAWSHDETFFKNIVLDRAVVSVEKPEGPANGGAAQSPGVSYGLVDEESKINLNLAKDSKVLKRLFMLAARVSAEDASVLADSLMDWIDEDDQVNADGAETAYYRGLKRPIQPKNAPLDALEEMLYVRGMTPEILKSISPYVTLYGDGKVNLNTAPGIVLQALGLDAALAQKILDYRNGLDKKPGTADDGIFNDAAGAASVFDGNSQFSDEERNGWKAWLAQTPVKTASDFYSVQSVAHRDRELQQLAVQCILQRNAGPQGWKEIIVQHE